MAVVWQRRDLNARHYRGPGSSPIVFENLLILTFDGIDRQYVAALDKNTGKTVWETPRSHDYKDLNEQGKPKGDGDYRKAYHTPSIALVAGRPQLITVASKAAFGLDPYTGKEIWVLEHGKHERRPAGALSAGLGHHQFRQRAGHALRSEARRNHAGQRHAIARALAAQESQLRAFVSGARRRAAVLHHQPRGALQRRCSQRRRNLRPAHRRQFLLSPVVAGNVLYLADEKGTTTVVRAASEYEELGVNTLEDGMRASPSVAGGAMYLRTFGHLYKIATPK